MDDGDRIFLLRGKNMSKESQTERLKHFFLSKGIKMSDRDLRKYERRPGETDESYTQRSIKPTNISVVWLVGLVLVLIGV